MLIKCLIANESVNDRFISEHGLSLLISYENYKILFDIGQSNLLFSNAEKFMEDLTDIDYLVISHGHYDHTGGLENFLKINSKAKIIVSEFITQKKYSLRDDKKVFRGINNFDNILDNYRERFIFINESFTISESFQVFQKVPLIDENYRMAEYFVLESGKQDLFEDELYLLLGENGKTHLFSGCSHRGIENIVKYFAKNQKLESVIGGFHLVDFDIDRLENLIKITNYFGINKIITGHCTANENYDYLENHLTKLNIEKLLSGKTYIL